MSKRLALALLAVVVLAGLVVGVLLATGGDDEDDPAGPTTTTSTTLVVSETGEELLDRLEGLEGRAVHILFGDGEDLELELWYTADGHVRQDLRLAAGELQTETRSLQTADGDYFCQRPTEGEWSCRVLDDDAAAEGERSGLVQSAAGDLRGAEVTTTDTELLGRPARCYDIAAASGTQSSLCVADDGTPLRVTVQGQVLTATAVDDAVPEDVLDLPAEPTPPEDASTSEG